MIVDCQCKNAYQDALYGQGKRVANYARKGYSSNPGYRCTVCGRVHPGPRPADAPAGKQGG